MRPMSWLVLACVLCACGGGETSSDVAIPVYAEAANVEQATDLGYTVAIDRMSMSVKDFRWVSYGSRVASRWGGIGDVFVSTAHAHPGHAQTGDILGVLDGRFVVEFFDDDVLGTARLLAGRYDALDVAYSTFETDDGLGSSDPRIGASVYLEGRALRDGAVTSFVLYSVAPADRELVGVPFEVEVQPDETRSVVLRFSTTEPFRPERHLFDGIDFESMPAPLVFSESSADEAVVAGLFTVQRRLLSHDYFETILENRK